MGHCSPFLQVAHPDLTTDAATSSHLVELENVEQFEELPVLLAVLELDVVLLQAVQGQLRLVVNVHLHRLDTEGGT
jgi:hypothetical protein